MNRSSEQPVSDQQLNDEQPAAPRQSRPLIDGSMIFFILLAVTSGTAVYLVKGVDTVWRAASATGSLIIDIAAPIAVGMLLGGLVREIVDPKRVSSALGSSSGWRGLVLASALGAVMPGGPFVAFPVVYALFLAGADVGAVIAFLTCWSLIALQRVIVWELPILGFEFVAIRVIVSLPLPILAGLLARRLAVGPLAVTPNRDATPTSAQSASEINDDDVAGKAPSP